MFKFILSNLDNPRSVQMKYKKNHTEKCHFNKFYRQPCHTCLKNETTLSNNTIRKEWKWYRYKENMRMKV